MTGPGDIGWGLTPEDEQQDLSPRAALGLLEKHPDPFTSLMRRESNRCLFVFTVTFWLFLPEKKKRHKLMGNSVLREAGINQARVF